MKCMSWNGTRLSRAFFGVGMIAMVGCAPVNLVYQPNPPDPSVQQLPMRLAVVELYDGSEGEGFYYGAFEGEPMIPGYIEGVTALSFHPTKFGKCLASELKSSRMFTSVEYFPNWERLVDDYRSYDLIVTGRLQGDKVEDKMISYGLPVVGAILWYAGFPAGHLTRDVSFEVVTFSPMNPGHEFWSQQVSFKDSAFAWLYTGFSFGEELDDLKLKDSSKPPKFDHCTTEFLQPQFLALRNSLAEALKAKAIGQGAMNVPNTQNKERSGS